MPARPETTPIGCSGCHKYSGCLPACSPNGRYIASTEEYRLTVREAESLQVVQLYSCLDRIRTVEWCSRSEYILCGLQNKQTVQVRNILGAGFLRSCLSDAGTMSLVARLLSFLQVCHYHACVLAGMVCI